jgi:hypothetical protein
LECLRVGRVGGTDESGDFFFGDKNPVILLKIPPPRRVFPTRLFFLDFRALRVYLYCLTILLENKIYLVAAAPR